MAMTQDSVLDFILQGTIDLYRVEKGKMMPKEKTTKIYLEGLGLPMTQFSVFHLEDQPLEVYGIRYTLKQHLDFEQWDEAEILLEELLRYGGFEQGINHQFVLSVEARLMDGRDVPPDEVLPLVEDGLDITYENWRDVESEYKILIFEEPELFHVLAKQFENMGEWQRAIQIAIRALAGIVEYPGSGKERERMALPLVLTLARCQIGANMLDAALHTCERGLDLSARRHSGEGTIELLLLKADILLKMGRGGECGKILMMAFAGLILVGEKGKALEVREAAEKRFGVSLSTYGIEELDIPKRKLVPYKRGAIPKASHIGQAFGIFRTQTDLTASRLCHGICSVSNLTRIESGSVKPQIHIAVPILQRLGRDPYLYGSFFLTKDDYDASELRDKIHSLRVLRRYDEAEQALEQFKKYKLAKKGDNPQFVKCAEAQFAYQKDGDDAAYEKVLIDELLKTCKDYDELMISRLPLSHEESIIVNKLAAIYTRRGGHKKASRIYEALAENLDRRYVDEMEKERMYPSVLIGLSSALARNESQKEASEVIDKAERLSRSRPGLKNLTALAGNKGFNLNDLGEKDEALKHLVLAYFCFLMFQNYGFAQHVQITRDEVKFMFGVALT